MRGLRRNNLLSTWDKFKEDLHERFGGSAFEDKIQELSHIQQTSSVVAYLERFEEILNEVSGQSETSLISFFVGGLKSELRNELNIIKPTSLQKAFSLAKVYEVQHGQGRHNNLAAIIEPLIKAPPTGAKGVPTVWKMMTTEERKECTAKGLCFNCTKSYSPGNKCKGRLFRMDANQQCMVEVVDQLDDEGLEEMVEDLVTTTEISLQALSKHLTQR